MRIEVKEDYPEGAAASNGDGARASSVKRKLRTESFCGAKKSANTVYES